MSYLLDRSGTIEINLVSYAAPVFTAVSGRLVLDEMLDLLSIVGFFGIFGGFLLLKRDTIWEGIPIPEWVDLQKHSER